MKERRYISAEFRRLFFCHQPPRKALARHAEIIEVTEKRRKGVIRWRVKGAG
jgi:hypothetical protein